MSIAKKIEAIKKYKSENPSATYETIREVFKCSHGTISRALRPLVTEEGDVIDKVIQKGEPTPLVKAMDSCPKTSAYIRSMVVWARKNRRRYLLSYLLDCLKEMEAVM